MTGTFDWQRRLPPSAALPLAWLFFDLLFEHEGAGLQGPRGAKKMEQGRLGS
jgi:hypothetical protein